MDSIFLNSENRKTSDPYILILNLSDKIYLKWRDQYVVLSNLSIYVTWENIKKPCKTNKYQLQCGIINLNYLTDHIPYQILIRIYYENYETLSDNPPIRISTKILKRL